MTQLRLSVYSQTPYVRFLQDARAPAARPHLSAFREGHDYEVSPGGVSRMVATLLGKLGSRGQIARAHWLALATRGPTRARLDARVALEFPRLPARDLMAYAVAKSTLWDAFHGIAPRDEARRPSLTECHRGLMGLAAAFARRTRDLHRRSPMDLAYVHDFQLLPLATYLPSDVPRVFRWHIPVPEETSPEVSYAVARLNEYDAVIVSTRGYAERLRAHGLTVPVHARYPYLDESRGERVVTDDDLAGFDTRWGLDGEDALFVLVARMDPMKSQDVAIRAIARAGAQAPHAKLMLVGGGGFSGGRTGGLGLSGPERWRADLEKLAADLGVASRVIFAGSLSDADLDVAYTRARAVLLPSRLEGFGLAAVEGWLYGRPILVSRGAGVAELVREGQNGHTFEPGDAETLAAHLVDLAQRPETAARLGEAGRATAATCHAENAAEGVWSILRQAAAASPRTRGPVPEDR